MNKDEKYIEIFSLYSKQNAYLENMLQSLPELKAESKKTILMINDMFLLSRINKINESHNLKLDHEQINSLTSIFVNLAKVKGIILDFELKIWSKIQDEQIFTLVANFSPLHLMTILYPTDSQNILRPNTTICSFLKVVLNYLQVDEDKIKEIVAEEYSNLSNQDEMTLEEFNSNLSMILSLVNEMEDNTVDQVKYEDLFRELNELIGLDLVKQEVRGYVNLVKANNSRKKMGMPVKPINLHMVFSGNPGTGKTTVARILSSILFKLGMVSKGHLVEVDRSMLVGDHIGQTALKTKEQIDNAKGGILFIDEAYSLARNPDSIDFGAESIITLVKYMEDYRDDLVIIMAGYTKEMKDFVQSNPGLTSRINQVIEFPDYDTDQLLSIFTSYCAKNYFTIDEDALDLIRKEIIKFNEYPKIFGNARGIRNMFEDLISVQSSRITNNNLLNNKAEINRIKAIDVLGFNRTLQ